MELIATTFREPLETVGVNLLVLQDEVMEVVEYVRNYLSIDKEQYHKVWYNLHVCPDANRWPQVLILCELCFSLPFSNGSVERMFSTLKVIKTDRRTRLHSDTLSDLLEIQVEGPSLDSFSPNQAVDQWWKDCKTTRRPNQRARKPYTPQNKGASTSTSSNDSLFEDSSEVSHTLSEWDGLFSTTESDPGSDF